MPFEVEPAVRVAVLGSCVTRDLFNRQFNPNYKDLFECVALCNQVSLISLMDPAVEIAADGLDDLDERTQRDVRTEISRSFLQELVETRPDYLIIDLFADVHFGCFSVDGTHLTRNRWKILKSRYYKETKTRDVTPEADRETYFRLWSDAVSRLLRFLAERLPETRVIVHHARNVSQYTGEDGSERPLGSAPRAGEMNAWWDRLDAELVRQGVQRRIDVFSDDLTSFESHPWGPFAVHYTLDYHAKALSKLTQIVLSDARADRRRVWTWPRRDTLAAAGRRLRRRVAT